jgi:hypothetical protein
MPAAFVSDADQYFEVGEGVSTETAVAIVALFDRGTLDSPRTGPEFPDLRKPSYKGVSGVLKASKASYYSLHISSDACGGCDGYIAMTPIFRRSKMIALRPESDYVAWACIEVHSDTWLGDRSQEERRPGGAPIR